ncbi:probable G-protein coupled receptor 32 [Carlito syrichta]|uniref:Probable G-protein coupled receptor 32 n=1 Tax=Carlito syrichta TaxID=1868482 RepID=A0A1U7SRN0_CARSF|nr:probable G-protein coupled receptor 32 [Carlito syrichta]
MNGVSRGHSLQDRPPAALTLSLSCPREMSDSNCLSEDVACLRWLTVAVLSVSFVVGVLGNGLVLWMMAFRMARTVPTVWFFNLALADFTVLLSLPVAIHSVYSGQWLLGKWACQFYTAFLSLTFFTSIWLLVLISADRCVSVLHPVWARRHRTVQRANWLAAGVWFLAVISCVPQLKFRSVAEWHGCKHCYFEFSVENKTSKSWDSAAMNRQVAVTVAHFLLGFLAPLAIIGACAHLIRARLRREGWVHASRPKTLLLVLVSAFFIFWLPFNLALVVQAGRQMPAHKDTHHPQLPLTLWATISLGCVNSCLNPFLYVFIGRDFQKNCFQSLGSLPSALARAFGEEGLLSPPASTEVKPPGSDGKLQAGTESLPSQIKAP